MPNSVYEPFLENPVKRRKKRKSTATKSRRSKKRATGLGRVGTRHRIVAITKRGGKLYTSPNSRIAKQSRRINPLGSEALILGANPVRRSRRRRRNPMGMSGIGVGGIDIMDLLVNGGTAVAGFITSAYGPKLLKVENPWLGIGTKVGIGVGGGMLLDRTISRNSGVYFATGAVSSAILDLVQMFVPQLLAGLSEDFGDVGAYDEMSAFPDEEVSGISAYPDEDSTLYGSDPYAE